MAAFGGTTETGQSLSNRCDVFGLEMRAYEDLASEMGHSLRTYRRRRESPDLAISEGTCRSRRDLVDYPGNHESDKREFISANSFDIGREI